MEPEWIFKFFNTIYYRGDHSFEGFIRGKPMTVRARTKREVDGLVRILQLEQNRGAQILDAPCGYGRHIIELARRGYNITGLDLQQNYVETATLTLRDKRFSAQVRQGSLQKIPLPDSSFDIAINMFFSFGFYRDDKDNFRCLREFARILRPGGRLLFHTDVNLGLIEAGEYNQPTLRRLEDGAYLHIEEELKHGTKRLEGSWTIKEVDGTSHRANYSMRVYSYEEFANLCDDAGLETIAAYGGFGDDTAVYDRLSEEMIVVAKKK